MKKILLAAVISLLFVTARAQQTSEQFNMPINYLLYLPQGYASDTTQKWPLMIFLHGSGESGSDIEKVKVHGPPKLIAAGKQFPCIVVSPQRGPMMRGWEPELMIKLIQDIKTRYRVDRSRVYLTGLSMGGFGTWNIAMKYPSEFAAIVPICGGGDIEKIGQLKNIPVWCFHGAKDNDVKLSESARLVDTLKKLNPHVKFTVYPEAGHDSWTETYNNDSLYTWLFAQKRISHAKIAISTEKLREYAGGYAQAGKGDTVDLVVDAQKLVVKQHSATELIPFHKDKFYISEADGELEIEFLRDKKGKVNRFIFYADKELLFYKVR
jgi:predicted esterase